MTVRIHRRQFAFTAMVLAVLAAAVFAAQDAQAQPTPEQMQAMMQARAKSGGPQPVPPGAKPGAKPGDEAKKDDNKAKADEQPEPKVIRRDAIDGKEADPDELREALIGEDGKVAFNFRNQPWVDLIQWLADISDQPLDWQELPADKVNLASPGRYTVEQTRDLFNRHLLARGYTLLELDGGITVMKTEGINPGMVRRVEERALVGLQPHTFVRTLMDVGWLSAEKLAEELKPMVSKNGRLTALTTTNRIEAMDAAINLQQIAELLQQERDVSSRDALAPEFRLTHIGAEEAKELLENFLGVEKKSSAPMSPQQMQQMQRMQQQNGGKPPTAKKESEISIVANTRQNSILVRAPRDKLAMASEFIRRVDVPSETIQSLEDIKARVQAFRLKSLDAEKLIEIVSEMNVLQPTTNIRVDTDNSAVVVSGPAVDRFIVKSLIEQLDGTGRQFEVLQLRRLDATEVTESISFLMGQDDDDEDDSSSRRYSYFSYGYGNNDDNKKESDSFRVAANTRYNQVLLWASESEMTEVRSLLVKLGELPPPGGSRDRFRVIEAASTPATYEYLQRLQKQWQSMSGQTLGLPDASEFKDPIPPATTDDEDADDDESVDNDEETLEATNASLRTLDPPAANQSAAMLTSANASDENADTPSDVTDEADADTTGQQQPPAEANVESMQDFDRQFRQRVQDRIEEDKARANGSQGDAGVQISLDSEGNLVLSGDDTKALDQLEDLMLKIRPPQREYVVFRLKHARASWITIDLEEYFGDEDEDDDEGSSRRYYYFYEPGDDGGGDDPGGLGGREKLKFVYNIETNTIIVSGASSSQLKTIRELIELWDVADPDDEKQMRFTKLVPVQYGRADKIAETLKEAYRDLLSGNDKAFQSKKNAKEGSGGQNQERSGNGGGGGGLTESESGQEGGGSDYNFKGKLSFGVDEIGNTLLISAEGKSLLKLMEEMVNQLDEAARPGGEVEVIQLDGNMSGSSIAEALKAFGLEEQQRSRGGTSQNPASSRRNRASPSRGRGRDD